MEDSYLFERLRSKRDMILVAVYGKEAMPANECKNQRVKCNCPVGECDCAENEGKCPPHNCECPNGDDDLRASVFQYVLDVCMREDLRKNPRHHLQLHDCMIAALKERDATVFRHIAKSIEAIANVPKQGRYPEAVMLLWTYHQVYFERIAKWKPPFALWDDYKKPTASELAASAANPENRARHIRRLAKALNIELEKDEPGPKRKMSKKVK